MSEGLRILVIDPTREMAQGLIDYLRSVGHHVDHITAVADHADHAESAYDVVIAAWADGGRQVGEKKLNWLLSRYVGTPLVLAVDAQDVGWAAEALSGAVFGYVLRPYVLAEVSSVLDGIEQARVVARVETNVQRFYQVLKQVQQLHGHLEPDKALSWLMDVAIEAVEAGAGAILLLEPESGDLVFQTGAQERHEGIKGLRVPAGEGICAWVAAHDEPQIVLDAQKDPRFYAGIDALTGLTTRSLLAVPLHKHGKVVGVVKVINSNKGYFSESGKVLLSLVASQASLALEKAQLLVESQAQVEKLTRLHEISSQLSATYDATPVLQLIAEHLTATLGPDTSSSINAYNRHEEGIQVLAAAGARPVKNLLHPPRPAGLVARARHDRRPVIVNDGLGNPMINPAGQRDQVQAALVVPLIEGERVWGALYVDTIAARNFSEADQQTAQFFANQIVMALRNARYVQQLLALTDIAEQLSAERQLRPLLDRICQQAIRLLDADSSCILLIVEEEGERVLRIWGHYGLEARCIEGTRDRVGESIAGRVAASGKPLIDNKIAENGRFSNPAAIDEKWLAIASVPIFRDGKVIGTLDIHSSTHTDAFTDDDLHILKLMARQVSIAIFNNELLGRFERVVSSAPECIIGVNAQGQVIEFNEEAERLLGCTVDKAKQMHVVDVYAGGFEEAQQINHQLLNSRDGRLRGHEATIRHANGDIIPIRLAAVQYKSATGQHQGSFGYFRDLREFQAVDEFAQSLLGLPEQGELLQRIVDTLARTLNAEMCLLLLYDHRTNDLKVQAIYGLPNEVLELSYPLNEGVVGQVFLANHSQRIATSQGATIEQESVRLGKHSRYGAIECCLAVPLAYQDEPFGVVLLLNKQQNNSLVKSGFAPVDESLLMTLANQIVGLLQHARYRAGLEALFAVGTEIVATLDEQALLQKIVTAVIETLGFRVVYFRLLEADGSLRIRASDGADKNDINNPAYTLGRDEGVTRKALETGYPFQISDLRKDDRFARPEIAARYGLRGLLAAPLIFEGQRMGTLSCYTARPHHFTRDEVALIALFANLAAVALANARQVGQLHRLEQAGKPLASVMRLNKVREAIAQHVLQVVGAEGAFVCLYDSTAERFELERAVNVGLGQGLLATRASRVWGGNHWGKSSPRRGGIVDTVMREGVVFVMDLLNPAEQKRIGKKTQNELLQAGIRAFVGVRLRVGEELVGVLFLNYRHPYAQSDRENENEVAILKIYADQAALAVIRARLFERQEQEQALIQSVARATSSMQDVKATWREILDGAMTLTQAERGNISLVDEVKAVVYAVLQKGLKPDVLARQHEIGGQSIQAWVAKHKKSALVRNVGTETAWCDIYYAGSDDTLSELAVPIMGGNSQYIVGIINLESPREGAFDEQDLQLLESLAIHAAIAVQNAQLYAEAQSRAKHLEKRRQYLLALHESAKAITGSLERDDTLQAILQEATRLTGAYVATIQEKRADSLYFEAIYPPEKKASLMKSIGQAMPLNGTGITVQAAKTRQPCLINDVSKAPTLFVDGHTGGTRSELAMPLFEENKVRGVLNVEHSQTDAFDEDDIEVLTALASLAVVALQNAERYEELQKTKDELLASQAVAWLGLFGADWQHAINQKIFGISNFADGLRRWLRKREVPSEISNEVLEVLSYIEKVADGIRSVPFTSLVPAEMPGETNGETVLDEELPKIVARWCDGRQDVEPILDLNCCGVTVKILPQWLKVAMEKLINNALKAMPDGGRLTLVTRLENDQVAITIKDTGHGLPASVRPNFLKQVIPHRKRKAGTGMGALIARFVALSHGGDLTLMESITDKGTTLRMTLPIAKCPAVTSNQLSVIRGQGARGKGQGGKGQGGN